MISKPKEPKVIGVNREIPEGIFGAIDMPPNNSNTERKKKKKKKEKSKFLQIGEHKIELTDMMHVEFDLKSGKTKKKKAKKLGKPKLPPIHVEPIKAPKKKKKVVPGVMPALEINYESTLPPEANGLPLDNVVAIPEDMLKRIAQKTEKRTKKLSKLMLNSVTPSMLSYDAASNYVKTVLADGLKIDVEVDRGVLDVVKELSRLDVIFFYLKRLSLPRSMKEHFMRTFIEELSRSSLETLKKADKSDAISSQLRELEGVIMKRSEHQAREANTRKSNAEKKQRVGLTEDARSVKRSRVDPAAPLMGGF